MSIAVSIFAQWFRLDQRQQTACRIARLLVRINIFDELMTSCVGNLHSVQGFFVDRIGFSTDMVAAACFCHHITFVGGVDEDLATDPLATLHLDRCDAIPGLSNSILQFQTLTKYRNLVFRQPISINPLGNMRLKHPELFFRRPLALPGIVVECPEFPCGRLTVPCTDLAVEFP